MSLLEEVVPEAKALSRGDKLRLIQLLAEELAVDECGIRAGQSYPVWSPYNAFAAAEVMLRALAADKEHS